ncbi:MAG TPA: hypothetical protein VEF04_13695 [Blastocatellia bacterium]|nr:hypothetical protein [Blastocatellia bacterium]
MIVHLKVVGVLMISLALLHALFPRRFNWKAELQTLSLLNRQLFLVHTFFIAWAVLLSGLLTLICAEQLVSKNILAQMVLILLTMFWGARWIAQQFYFSPKLWRGHRLNTVIHVVFTLLWTYFVTVYLWALLKAR